MIGRALFAVPFSLTEFKDLTCFEIAHTSKGFDIWHHSKEPLQKDHDEKKGSYNPKTAHPTCLELARIIGAAPKKRASSSVAESGSTERSARRNRMAACDESSDEDAMEGRPAPLRLTNVAEYHNNNST